MKIAILIIISISIALFLSVPSAYNPLTPKGEAIGIFINGSHRGYGDFCGQYPMTWIRFRNATYDKSHWWGEKTYCDFHFGNEYEDIDNMIIGKKYKIWYHEEGRPSDVTPVHTINYWVVDGYERI